MTLKEHYNIGLFGTGEALTQGQKLFFKVLELYVLFQACDLAWSWAAYILKIQDVVLTLGIANYIDVSFMFGNNTSLWLAGVMSLLSFTTYLRFTPRWSYLIVFAILHLLYATRYCLGEIPHSANFIGLSTLALGVAFIFFDENKYRYPFFLGAIYFFVGFGYTNAAICKLIATGPSWVDGRHLWLWMTEKSVDHLSRTGEFGFNFLQELSFVSIPVATVILLIGLFTELFGFLIWFRKTRPFIILAVLGMHIGIYLTMKIWFGKFMSELVLIGFPWALWLDKWGIADKINWKFLDK